MVDLFFVKLPPEALLVFICTPAPTPFLSPVYFFFAHYLIVALPARGKLRKYADDFSGALMSFIFFLCVCVFSGSLRSFHGDRLPCEVITPQPAPPLCYLGEASQL